MRNIEDNDYLNGPLSIVTFSLYGIYMVGIFALIFGAGEPIRTWMKGLHLLTHVHYLTFPCRFDSVKTNV